MAEVASRMENPSPGILFQEIHIPDDADLGTGTFRFQVSQEALIPPAEPESTTLAAGVVNRPSFQLSVSVNPDTRRIPIQLGRADGTPPLANRVFALPSELDPRAAHEFSVVFRGWAVVALEMDGRELESIP